MDATPAQDTARELVVPARFRGPARTGNGGYVSGLVAGTLTGPDAAPVTVTLRTPPPLDTPMRVEADGTQVQVFAGERLVAEATFGTFTWPPPDAVDADVAAATAPDYAGHGEHPFRTCFTCGPDREPGDGLRVFPGTVDGRAGTVAATWTADSSVDAGDGRVAEAVAWAALDCPGGWALDVANRPMVLGRMTGLVLERPAIGQRCVAVGQSRGLDGRKGFSSTALYAGDRLLGRAEAVWITIDPEKVNQGP